MTALTVRSFARVVACTTMLVGISAWGQSPPANAPQPSGGPSAAPLPVATIPRPSWAQAQKALDAAFAHARQANVSLSCAIVDAHGDSVAQGRMDDAYYLTSRIALAKAVTSATFGVSSGGLGAMGAELVRSLNGLVDGGLMNAQGAVPIVRDGHVIGAIGCSGGPSHIDEDAAKAGLAKF